MDEVIDALRKVGLSERETKVYLNLLSQGPSTVNQVSEGTDLLRTTTYDVLKSLRDKGLVSSINADKVLQFQAASPKKIISDLEEKQHLIENVADQMSRMSVKKNDEPAIEYYKGKEGVKTVWQSILEQRKPLSAFGSPTPLFEMFPIAAPRFIKERIKRKIPGRLLCEKTPEAQRIWKSKDKQELRETRFIDELKNIGVAEYIYGDYVAILGTNTEEPMGLIIRNQAFAKQQLTLFEILWNRAEK